jgi:hypothetical protein
MPIWQRIHHGRRSRARKWRMTERVTVTIEPVNVYAVDMGG